MRSRATSKARRGFPEPPAPVRVKSRVVASAWLTSNASSARPTKLLRAAGRLCWGVLRLRCVLPVLKTFRFGNARPAIPQESQEVCRSCALASRGGYLSHIDHDAPRKEIAHPPNG